MNILTKSHFLALSLSFVTSVLSNSCDDDSSFEFGSFTYNGQDIARTCAWLTENAEAEQNRKDNWCTEQWRDDKVEDMCPSTCGIDRCMSKSCDDDSSFEFGSFTYNGQDIARTCAWLTENTEAEQKRKDNWCTQQWRDDKVEDMCPNTCGIDRCTSKSCDDDSSFEFGSFTYNGQDIARTCAWLTENAEAEQKRKDNWCTEQWGNDKVEDMCPNTCGIDRCTSDPDPDSDQLCTMDYPRYWSDSDGFDCSWYARGDNNCGLFGSKYENLGRTANQACCTCGGGCNYKLDSIWHDNDGSDFNCSWYAENTARCNDRSDNIFRNDGFIANEACCACIG